MKSSDTQFEDFLVPESDKSLIGGHFLHIYGEKDLIWLLLSPYTESFALETPQKVPSMYVNTNAVSIIYAFLFQSLQSPGENGWEAGGKFFMSTVVRTTKLFYQYFSLLVLESSLSSLGHERDLNSYSLIS